MISTKYKPLPLRIIKADAGFHRPRSTYKPVQADSPAIESMTDLQKFSVSTISVDATVSQATQKMVARGVRLLLVANYIGEILGVITARDTMGERPIKHLQQNGGKHGDLTVRDCMTPVNKVEVLSLKEVQRAKVGHIVATLESSGRQHAIVVDADANGEELIRGIFSITQIGRQLGMTLEVFDVAKTFAEIDATLEGVA
jgi:CBS-domain-containing membrane protein